jgi:hypothetical protein
MPLGRLKPAPRTSQPWPPPPCHLRPSAARPSGRGRLASPLSPLSGGEAARTHGVSSRNFLRGRVWGFLHALAPYRPTAMAVPTRAPRHFWPVSAFIRGVSALARLRRVHLRTGRFSASPERSIAMPTCHAHNSDGTPCKARAVTGFPVCRMHGAGSPTRAAPEVGPSSTAPTPRPSGARTCLPSGGSAPSA